MNSSSDESFAWENASSGSDDAGIEYPNMNGEGDEIKVKHERSIYNGEEDDNIKEPKPKKGKHMIDVENGFDEVESPKKKKVKTEPDHSDSDVKKKKKKKASKPSVNGYINNSNECDQLGDDKYLDMLVKQEQEYADHVKPKKSKKRNSITPDAIQENHKFSDSDIPKKQKKSKKKKKLKEPHFDENNDQSYNSDELTINEDQSSNLEDGANITHIESHSHQPPENELQKNISDETFVSLEKTALKEIVQSTPNIISNKPKHNPERLLDRIQFEEDPDSDIDKILDINDLSADLKKYLSQNEDLQVVSQMFQNSSEITVQDEIWILKCPHDVDVQKLLHTELSLDKKSKLKINSETYSGNLDENDRTITIMTSNKNNFIIKNTVSNGTIHFRKRLPKPHVQDHNVMVNNQIDFIPLPETKCRHPLFGSNYKDAINTRVGRTCPDHVAVFPGHEKKKKKKHKRDRKILPKVEMDTDISFEKSPKREIESDVSVKKAKKRKHTNDGECVKKKSKKIKLEPDSVEAWESEKAIEENLFNF